MKDELISYETARVAKEKGFNLKVYNYFQISAISRGVEKHSTGHINDINTTFKESAMFSRPTQGLLQRWLREVHKIDITPSLVGNGYGFYIHKDRKYTNKGESYGVSGHTYEKALEAGLQQALNLI